MYNIPCPIGGISNGDEADPSLLSPILNMYNIPCHLYWTCITFPVLYCRWYINGEEADPSLLSPHHIHKSPETGLETSRLDLRFRLTEKHFRRAADLKLKCTATIATIYWRSNEEAVQIVRKQTEYSQYRSQVGCCLQNGKLFIRHDNQYMIRSSETVKLALRKNVIKCSMTCSMTCHGAVVSVPEKRPVLSWILLYIFLFTFFRFGVLTLSPCTSCQEQQPTHHLHSYSFYSFSSMCKGSSNLISLHSSTSSVCKGSSNLLSLPAYSSSVWKGSSIAATYSVLNTST